MKVLFSLLIGSMLCLTLIKGLDTTTSPIEQAKVVKTNFITNPTIDSVVTFDRGMLIEKQHFSKGMIVKKEGFTPQNKLAYSNTYVNGLKHGTWTEFYENGQKYQEVNYAHGQRNGSQNVFYSDGSFQYWVEWISDMQLSRLDYPRPNDQVLVSPSWKRDGC